MFCLLYNISYIIGNQHWISPGWKSSPVKSNALTIKWRKKFCTVKNRQTPPYFTVGLAKSGIDLSCQILSYAFQVWIQMMRIINRTVIRLNRQSISTTQMWRRCQSCVCQEETRKCPLTPYHYNVNYISLVLAQDMSHFNLMVTIKSTQCINTKNDQSAVTRINIADPKLLNLEISINLDGYKLFAWINRLIIFKNADKHRL